MNEKWLDVLAEKLRKDAYDGLPTMWADVFRLRVDFHLKAVKAEAAKEQ